jgi:hypothetical protein
MAHRDLRARDRDGANFVYRDNRLLIGWRTSKIIQIDSTPETLRIEAWLGEISAGEAASMLMPMNPVTTYWLRVYTSSDGSELMHIGVMGIDEAHPATLHPEVEGPSFLQQGETERLKSVETDMHKVRIGRWKYSEREGGELKFFERAEEDIVEHMVEMPHNGKRDWGSADYCPSPSTDGHDGKRICARSTPDGDDCEDDIPPKNETLARSGSASTETFADQSTQDNYDFNKTFESSMTLKQGATNDEKKAEQKNALSLMQLATQLGADVNHQAYEWALPANKRCIDLNEFTAELSLAGTVAHKIAVCRKIFTRMGDYHAKFIKGREAQQ